ncbi:MAG: rRNA maturation RNase YbeY [Candidatus Muiribacteriaceae bacterium]
MSETNIESDPIISYVTEDLTGKVLEADVTFVDKHEIKRLNSEYRNIDRPTDVLSFSLREGEMGHLAEYLLGDIVICKEIVQLNANDDNIDFSEELIRVIIHGLLHLLGYDHAEDDEAEKMFSLQERYVDFLIKENIK